ncbi:hypothetical protein I7I51_04251 [Histoplasma capsulatum]|uniref:Uncharacterized protein n=1 Tax=Ajellomyces capsulatus TaxID=5037 RepID=A0A8A1MBT5_AJECA|nr:hypothetical protein I7I51_04251 [Histoplasma capsulatum]
MVDNKNIECVPILDASNIIQDNHRPQVPANRSLADYELVSTSGCSGGIVAHAVYLDQHLTERGNDFLRGTLCSAATASWSVINELAWVIGHRRDGTRVTSISLISQVQ